MAAKPASENLLPVLKADRKLANWLKGSLLLETEEGL